MVAQNTTLRVVEEELMSTSKFAITICQRVCYKSDTYLGPSQTFMMELFRENS